MRDKVMHLLIKKQIFSNHFSNKLENMHKIYGKPSPLYRGEGYVKICQSMQLRSGIT